MIRGLTRVLTQYDMTVVGLSSEGTLPSKREEKLHALLTFLESKQDGIFVLPVHSCSVAAETDTMRKNILYLLIIFNLKVKLLLKANLFS